MPRDNLGLNRTTCERCGHREDQHVDREGARVCIVCDRREPKGPCGALRTE